MPSWTLLRAKFEKATDKLQQWPAMVKRRVHAQDEGSQGSRGSKQQRMMTTTIGDQDGAVWPSTPPAFSSSVHHSAPINAAAGINQNQEGSAANPIDLTGSPSASACLPDGPTDSLIAIVHPLTSIPSFDRKTLRKRAVVKFKQMKLHAEKMTQIEQDRRTAEILQQQLYSEDEVSPGQDQLVQSLQALRTAVDADPLGDFSKRLQHGRCTRCKAAIGLEGAALIQRTSQMLKQARYFHPCVLCSKCKGRVCIHCGGYHTGTSPKLKHVVSSKGFKTAWCCDQGRLFLILSLLCGPEPTTPPSGSSKPGKSPDKGARPSASTSNPSILSKGTGYGDSSWDWRQQMSIALPQARKNTYDDTGDLTLYFEALSLLLPSTSTSKATTPFDREPQPIISEMIQRSPMMARASEVLRHHGAIEEINKRCRPIAVVLDFLETLAGHESTCPLLFYPRVLYPTAEQLPQIAVKTAKTSSRTQKLQNTAGGTKYETSESLAAVAEHLAIPARKFVEASRRVNSLDVEYEKGESLVVLKRICSIADSLKNLRAQLTIGTPQEPSSPPYRRPTPNVTTRNARNAAKEAESKTITEASKAASEWHRANCLKEVSDDVILNGFHFATAARAAGGVSKPPAGRMRKLLAQVSSLSTDLPDGIYVRHGESRLDVMKVLIIGPPETPYEHGLFEFDLFCGPEFPQRPPEMFFRTTGDGVARFNPNLYENGKICFSLLGTWQGQPWNSDHSTLLQLLVSIQAMIFNDQPYYNEPGYELRGSPVAAQKYNRNIEALTVRHAMIPWLADRLVVSGKQTGTTHASPAELSNQKTLAPTQPVVAPPGHQVWAGGLGYDDDDMELPYGADMETAEYLASLGLYHGHPTNTIAGVVPSAASGSEQGLQPPPGGDDPVFGVIIREHFRAKASLIVTTVQKWERLSEALAPTANKLEKLLDQHGFNDWKKDPWVGARIAARQELLQRYQPWRYAGNASLPPHAHGNLAGSPHLAHQATALTETTAEEKSALQKFVEKWKAYKASFLAAQAMHPAMSHPPAAQAYQNTFAQPYQITSTQQTGLLSSPFPASTSQAPHESHSYQAHYHASHQAYHQIQAEQEHVQEEDHQGDSAGLQSQAPQLPPLTELDFMVPDYAFADYAWPDYASSKEEE